MGPIAAAALSAAAAVSNFVPDPHPSTAAPGQTSGSQAHWHAQRELRAQAESGSPGMGAQRKRAQVCHNWRQQRGACREHAGVPRIHA